ncbi:MAG: hypothetical protein LM549_16550, partial [Candidatus Competibacter sp.]|nr:hypothetical protein [Candidatus Competibacter sp.]
MIANQRNWFERSILKLINILVNRFGSLLQHFKQMTASGAIVRPAATYLGENPQQSPPRPLDSIAGTRCKYRLSVRSTRRIERQQLEVNQQGCLQTIAVIVANHEEALGSMTG